jgi:hypothetical protein
MKIRILMLSIIGLIFFNSCSTDNNSSNSTSQNLDPNTILPKKIIRESLYGFSETYDFYYTQNKLDHIHRSTFDNGEFNSEYDINFTYNGDFISETNVIDNTGQIYEKTEFTYLNNKLVNKMITYYDENGISDLYDYSYTYNSSNNIITRTGVLTINGSALTETDIFTITNNLITKNNFDITYSNTSSPFKNIIGIKDALVEGGTEYKPYMSYDVFFSTTKNIINVPSGRYVCIYNEIEFPTSLFYYENLISSSFMSLNFQILYQ